MEDKPLDNGTLEKREEVLRALTLLHDEISSRVKYFDEQVIQRKAVGDDVGVRHFTLCGAIFFDFQRIVLRTAEAMFGIKPFKDEHMDRSFWEGFEPTKGWLSNVKTEPWKP